MRRHCGADVEFNFTLEDESLTIKFSGHNGDQSVLQLYEELGDNPNLVNEFTVVSGLSREEHELWLEYLIKYNLDEEVLNFVGKYEGLETSFVFTLRTIEKFIPSPVIDFSPYYDPDGIDNLRLRVKSKDPTVDVVELMKKVYDEMGENKDKSSILIYAVAER